MIKAVYPVVALAALSGCDMASDLAGDAIADQLRSQYLEQCQGVARSAGIASDLITPACECSADEFAADLSEDGQVKIDTARIARVLRTCVRNEQGAEPDASAENGNG